MIYLATRQMLSRKKQTLLIFLGISLGTAIYIIIAGLQLGMRNYISDQLLNNTAHILIQGREEEIDPDDIRNRLYDDNTFVKWLRAPFGKREESRLDNPQGWFDRLAKDPQVYSYAPRLSSSAIISKGPLRKNITVTGIVPDRHVKVTNLEDYMKEGSLRDLSTGAGKIVLGSGIIKEIGARVGDIVNLSSGLGETSPFKIIGKLHLGNEQLDDVMALAHIHDVQTLNKTPGRVSEISVALHDIEQSATLAERWSLYTIDRVQGWEEANASFMQIIKIQDIVRYVITGAILLVAAFGIYNVLSIMISQKQKEIAILRSIGYGPNRILELFLIQGLILGMLGGAFGLLLGHSANVFIGSIDLGFDIGKGSTLIISYAPSIYLTAFFSAQIAAAIASVLPARHAAKLTPLEIIRSNT